MASTRSAPLARHAAFTLVELLVVVAVIAILISVLLPAISGARDSARTAQASNNVRQLVQALFVYSNDYDRQFPPNITGIPDPQTDKRNMYWHNTNRIGKYIPQADTSNLSPDNTENDTVGGGMLTSPMHPAAGRSFTMNYWASSAIAARGSANGFTYYKPGQNIFDPTEQERGLAFGPDVDRASDVFLVSDAWGLWGSSYIEDNPTAEGEQTWFTGAQVGAAGYPGQRFGGGDNPVDAATETRGWVDSAPEMAAVSGNQLPTYIPFYRYPKRQLKDPLTRDGAALCGCVDGHGELRTSSELVDDASGRSSYEVLWTPKDKKVEDAFLGPAP